MVLWGPTTQCGSYVIFYGENLMSNTLNWAFSILAIMSLYPYFLWNNSYIYKSIFIFTLILTFVLLIQKKIKKNDIKIFLVLLFWCLYAIFPRNLEDLNFFSTGVLAILTFSLLPDENKLNIFERFRHILCMILLISIIEYPLIVLGIIGSIGNIEPFSEIKLLRGQFYINYIFNIVLNDQHLSIGSYSFFRFSSIFDEPGLIGSVCAILFFTYPYNQLNKNFKIERSILLTSVILSFSLGGYLLFIIGYFLYFIFSKSKNKIKKITLISIFMIFGISILSNTEGGKKYITERVWNNNGLSIAQNNRVDSNFEQLYIDNYNYPLAFILGNGKDAHVKTGFDVSSYKGFIYNYGLLGVLTILFVFIYIILIKKCSIEIATILGMILLNSFQRPIELNFYYYFILLSMVCYYDKTKK